MKPSLADRLLLVVVLEVSALLVTVASADGLADLLAASAFDDRWLSDALAAVLVVAWIAIPILLLVRGLVDRPDRFVQRIGWVVLGLGVMSALLSRPGAGAVTLSLVGALLATYSLRLRPEPT